MGHVAFQEGGAKFPVDANGKTQYSDVDYMDTWKGMEEAQKSGLTKSIGVSNFNKKQIERVLAEGTIKPVTNQVWQALHSETIHVVTFPGCRCIATEKKMISTEFLDFTVKWCVGVFTL